MPEYQSLYRKYRSQTFADLVGQEAASRALQGAIISSRVAHAYLFSGSRGTGKTSAARLLAKALNCSGRSRDSAEPCNKCQSCLEMTAGSALDLIETTRSPVRHDRPRQAFGKLRLIRFTLRFVDSYCLLAVSDRLSMATLDALGDTAPRQVQRIVPAHVALFDEGLGARE